MFPGNPYALFNNNVITDIFYAGENTKEEIELRLKDYSYDRIISFEEYGRELFIGEDILEDGFVRTIPVFKSWVWNNETRRWNSPIPQPVQEGLRFYWDEESLSWLEDNISVVGTPSVAGNCCSNAVKSTNKENVNAN
jgi:hypothetical protein